MRLLIGTDLGLHCVEEVPFEPDDVERVLDCGKVTSLRTFEHTSDLFVSAESGAYRSADGGRTWDDLGVPTGDRYWYEGQSDVWSILSTADGALYAGTNDPYLYRSVDDGRTWTELRGLRTLPSRGVWESPRDPHYARVRALEIVPGRPECLVVGIEAGGIHRSYDAGRTWVDRRDESPTDDIHQVLPLGEDVFLAATGHLDLDIEHLGLGHAVGRGGVHRTTDGGETWTRLDEGNEFDYVRRVFVHDETLFFCGTTQAPPLWSDDANEAALFESTDFGRTFERVPYPGEKEAIEAWAVADGQILCGAGLYNVRGEEGRDGLIIRRTDDGEYRSAGTVPGNVSDIAVV